MSKEEKMLILEMVSQGKITPEQGVELLRQLVTVRALLLLKAATELLARRPRR